MEGGVVPRSEGCPRPENDYKWNRHPQTLDETRKPNAAAGRARARCRIPTQSEPSRQRLGKDWATARGRFGLADEAALTPRTSWLVATAPAATLRGVDKHDESDEPDEQLAEPFERGLRRAAKDWPVDTAKLDVALTWALMRLVQACDAQGDPELANQVLAMIEGREAEIGLEVDDQHVVTTLGGERLVVIARHVAAAPPQG
jgi:hypothetical protein